MTIQEAIKSGKPFKRKHEIESMYCIVRRGYFVFFNENRNAYIMGASDILATDWEVKQ